MEQTILEASDGYAALDEYFQNNGIRSIFLVCDGAFRHLPIAGYFDALEARKGIRIVKFSGFDPNPRYESVVCGVKEFRAHRCDMLVAVGGGSSIDVAKCVKLYSNMDDTRSYLEQTIVPNGIRLLAVPTTAGTGSEATRYAVIYYGGEKQSISDVSCIPSAVLFDVSALRTLPDYQRKSTALDAFCHSVESFWSVNSTSESKAFSKEAIRLVLENMDGYIRNEEQANGNMLKAAHLAGRAINITQTTAGHAMCYKLTSLYGLAHGHAAALCVAALWPYMAEHCDLCLDPRGSDYLAEMFQELADAMGSDSPLDAADRFKDILAGLSLKKAVPTGEQDFQFLRTSVNPVRLKNNPVRLTEESIDGLYRQILQ
ncbi:MAG: phosphonoacetaldehyde reductase [Treponema sp.]|nr:phosphonoacetaldehyde reductase [Treponema sp.]